mmetsp:Transcript_15867/g.19353  ORF Transcript_15867/g.19353 Transcript_15867/m.19353 type:complete len:487 (-) Transcript_15867:2897-4357(-)
MSGGTKRDPCWLNCTASEACDYLLNHRFDGDTTATATFFLQAIDQLPNVEEINQLLNQEEDEEEEEKSNPLGKSIEELPQADRSSQSPSSSSTNSMIISGTTPRSKFTLTLYENGMILTNNKNEEVTITSEDVEHVIIFPKREDCLKVPKKPKAATDGAAAQGYEVLIPGSMVLLVLTETGVTFRQKQLSQICFQLPQHHSDTITEPDSNGDINDKDMRNLIVDSFEEQWSELLKKRLKVKNISRIYNPKVHNLKRIKAFTFQSDEGGANTSIMQGGMPFVKCYSGVNDGVVYPMKEGLLFFKPPQFVHRSKLHSISCGRGSGGSRYVDLVATLDEKDSTSTLEFTNIDREETPVLNSYIQNVLIKEMQKDVEEEDGESDSFSKTDEETESFPDKEVVKNVLQSSSSKKRKSTRSAALDARKSTKHQLRSVPTNDDEDDDDEDEDDDFSINMNNGDNEEDDSSDGDDYDCSDAGEEESATDSENEE